MSAPPSSTGPKIAVVDDDHEILKLLSLLLRRIGAESNTFYNGQEILQYLETEIPDLIILDLMMPEVDGMEVLRQIREQDRFDQVLVLILSAKTDQKNIQLGLTSGADDYITKPYVANTLIDRIRSLLRSKRQASSG